METLHLSLKFLNEQQIELRYWRDQPSRYEDKVLAIAEISDLIDQSELDYYVLRPNLVDVGQRLFNWIDGEGRWLSRAIQDCASEGIVLAIAPDAKIAHLPWEILHDATDFLVNKSYPMIVPIRWLDQRSEERVVQDRPLQVLFMATSPEQVKPVLQFEQEEATLLKITENLPLTLRVEESGCVEELKNLWRRYPQDTFDVFHLTGHADHKPESPYTPFFITESLTGERQDTSAEDLLRVFQQRRPRLMFLSGCRTGQASQEGTVPSLAETLVDKGMPAVMGWGRPVLDTTATQAAAKLYESLAAGDPLAQALSITYRELIQNQVKGWHLLRLYVRGESWGPVVEPPGYYVPPPEQIREQFLDHQGLVRVATPDQFVGRRRILQQSLRALQGRNTLGVILHGMGGVGKSTVAARLLERLPEYQPIVIFQGLDAAKLERLLRSQCLSPKGREILEFPEDRLPFMQRLTAFFDQGLNTSDQRFLFVLDDFEANLELRGGQQVLKTEVVEVLNDLLQALSRSKSPHRLLITSRYDIQFPQLNERLTRVSLAALRGADLQKKCDRLVSFQRKPDVDSSLQVKALTLADGNPRLLEWLDKVLQVSGVDSASILNSMEGKAAEFREDILAEELLEQQSEEVQQMLARMQVFELPVPYTALSSICQGINALEQYCQRATALGLLEHNASSSESFYRLPRILIPLLPQVETETLYQSGLDELYRLWWTESEGWNEEQAIELIRLATLAKDDERLDKLGTSLGIRWHNQGRYRDAIRLYEQIVGSRQKLLGTEHPDVAQSLNNLAALYDNQGRYEAAEPLYVQALEMRQKLLGTEHPDVAGSLNNLAGLYKNQGRYEAAEPLYEQALEMHQKLLGTEHPDVAGSLNNLAGLYDNQGRYEAAEPLYVQALEMRQKLLGTEHPDVAGSLNNLAGLYDNQGRYEAAEPLYVQALEMRQKLLGTEHPDVATSLNGLAGLYDNQGRYEAAEPLYVQALEMRQKLLGTEHPDVATSLNNLALLYYNQGRYEAAEPLLVQALEMYQKLLGTEHPSVALSLNNLAGLYKNQGRYEAAEPLLVQALEMKQKLLGTEHPSVALSLNNLAALYYNQGRYEEAKSFLSQALKIVEKALGPEHPNTLVLRNNLESLP
ncbi:tetratricopeptide repeat protein [Acaryochloris marina NIES-2412]|uniref:tetratricopeptide repeat protein n=1 Tax=Acaryochloris marina TaxID=155978 RepID=UPI004058B39C